MRIFDSFLRFSAILLVSAYQIGCPGPVNPIIIDSPPAIGRFTVSPESIKQGESTTFTFSASDDNSIDRIILDYDDGTADTLKAIGKTSYASSKTKTYSAPGVKTATLSVFDDANQKTAKTVSVGVDAVLAPVFDKTSLPGVEGKVGAYAKRDIAHDPQGLPIALTVVSSDPNLSVTETADSIKVAGKNTDVNGSYSIQMKADNNTTSTVQNVTSVLAARDDISGRVRDALEGTHIAGLYPELVMKGPFTGWVAMKSGTDSVRIPINSDGTFRFAKTVPANHRVYRFATNGADSSFVAYDDFAAGDRVVDAFVHTNAGTDNTTGVITRLPLPVLQDLYLQANNGTLDQGTKSMDLTKTNTFYLAGKDILLNPQSGVPLVGLTPAQQDSVEGAINEWKALLPPDISSKIIIYKAPQGENIPQTINPVTGFPRPPPQMAWVFKNNNSGVAGTFGYFPDENNYNSIIESAIMTFSDLESFERQHAVQVQECGSWFCPGQIYGSSLDGKTTFFESAVTPLHPTHADKKLLWIRVLVKPNVPLAQYFSLH
jgi:hypothetical protein